MNPSKVVLSEKDFEELFDLHFENLMGFVCSYVHGLAGRTAFCTCSNCK